jgi:hypothetical protein
LYFLDADCTTFPPRPVRVPYEGNESRKDGTLHIASGLGGSFTLKPAGGNSTHLFYDVINPDFEQIQYHVER